MCGAYGAFQGPNEYWKKRYELIIDEDWDWYSYNVRPTQEAVVIIRQSPKRAIKLKFGIDASWKPGMMLINAKSETVNTLRTFRKMFLENRCLIPASFFYEWQRLKDMKQPYAFAVKDEKTFSFAGIHNEKGFVILTTTPNELISQIHNRMPLILQKGEDEELWLNPDTTENQLLTLLKPYPSEKMKKWPVSSLVNTAKNNFPELLNEVKL